MKRLVFAWVLAFVVNLGFSQSITVTAPNGGEQLYACQSYTITWNASGTSTYYDLDYSLNGGTIWATIATNINVTNGQYTWTVPNVESNNCLVRVRDKNNNAIEDVSNAVFAIHIPVTVTSPNGGESWQALSQQLITWDIQGTSLTFNLDYSTNGGSTWTSIVTGLSTSVGSYNWTVPNVPGTTCLVRVRDAVTNCMQDVSNNVFTITPLSPVMTYPNGGQSFSWGQVINITWNSSTYYSNVRLEYSLDNGVTWVLINSSTTNDGSEAWTVPSNVNSTTCLVKVSTASNVLLNDVSNATFSILRPTLVLNSPVGGESYLGCNSYNVSATLTGMNYLSSSYLYIRYSTDAGATWSSIASPLISSSGTVTQSWTIPNGISSTQCLVRAYSLDYSFLDDTSNTYFSIQPNNVVAVTYPNGGESFVPFSNATITWTNTADASGLYNIQYSSNGGSTYTTIAAGVSGNSYLWTNIPNTPTNTYLIKVVDAGNTCRFDVSNANFTVTPLSPVMTYPNGGQSFSWGQVINITWNSSTYYSNVRLEYSLDNGVTWVLINSSTTNDGSEAWTVPSNVNSTTCLVKVSTSSNVLLNDVSNATFSILRPTLVLNSPVGGESYLGCNSYNVSATLTGMNYLSSSYLYIRYSTDAGATWSSIASPLVSGSGTVTQSWTIPNGISSTQCLVRAYSLDYSFLDDTSNTYFSIQPNNVVAVTYPNGGESFVPFSNATITWTNTADASGLYNIQYSSNGGSTFTTIASGVSGNSYLWTNIPNTPTNTYLIKVVDAGNTCRFDVSNANFTVTPLSPVMTYPNGGQSLVSLSTVNITWNSSTYYSNVRLEYSLDNGLSWILITSSTTNDGTEAWTLPFANSTTCLVKVSTASNVLLNDVSNATFSITPIIQVTTPNGFDQIGACTQTSISFTHPSSYTSFDIAYSLNNGTTWSTIVSSLTQSGTTGTYNWSVPNIASTQVLVRVSPAGSSAYGDVSDTTFTIRPAVTLIQPNFGGLLQVGTSYPIKWSSDGISNLYDLAYSTAGNAGPWTNIVIGYNTANNTYNWTVPNISSTNCYIRVRDNAASCKEDISNLAFTISSSSSPITVLTSNGGDTLQGCQNYTITWTESGTPLGNYKIDLSPDGGITWTNIVNNYATTSGNYSWVVPNINTDQALIRVGSPTVTTIYDVSNAAFVIQSRSVRANADTAICPGATVNLQASGGVGNYSWSPTTYLNNPNIANPVATPSVTTRYVLSSTNGTCAIRDTVTISVQQVPTFTVVREGTYVCSGTQTNFTAHVIGGGINPSYQWKLNGANVGTNDSTLALTNLHTGDSVYCLLTFNPSCFAAIRSNTLGIDVYQKPNLGNDTTVTVSCAGCTFNLNSLYNTSGYLYASWNTINPAAAAPGLYRLVVSQLNGCTCPDSDTTYVNVTLASGSDLRACAGGTYPLRAASTGLTYQWQVNRGSGYVNVTDDGLHSGVQSNTLIFNQLSGDEYGYQYRCLVDGVPGAPTTLKTTAYWTGAANNDWENPGNWSCGVVPDKNTDVYIYNGKPNYPEINCDRACRSISATSGTSLKVNGAKILYLTGK